MMADDSETSGKRVCRGRWIAWSLAALILVLFGCLVVQQYTLPALRRAVVEYGERRRVKGSLLTAKVQGVLSDVKYWVGWSREADDAPFFKVIHYSGRLGEWDISLNGVPFDCLDSLENALGSTNEEVPNCWPGGRVVVRREVPPQVVHGKKLNDYRFINTDSVWCAIHERSPAKLKTTIDEAESELVPED
jgi:hypothetical protein